MKYFLSLLIALTLSAPVAMSAQPASVSTPPAPLSAQDTEFLRKAADAGMFEMQASQLAIQNAAQERVKEFARVMLVEHERIDGDLKSLAMIRKVELPEVLEGDRMVDLGEVQQMTGADFDRWYMEYVAVKAHEDGVKLYSRATQTAKDGEVKAFAEKNLKLLKEHLERGKRLASDTKVTGR